MAKGFFVVYCLQTLRQPKLYKVQHFALRLAQQSPTYTCQAFPDQAQANLFLADQLQRYQLACKQKTIAILQNNLEGVSTRIDTPQPVVAQPQKEDSLIAEKRAQREKEVGELLVAHRVRKESSYKSTEVSLDGSVHYLGYFDGCSKNNPGPSGAGYHIDHPDHRTLISRSQFISSHATNNQAELIALNLLLADAYCNHITALTVLGDSQLAIKFMRGEYRCANQYMKDYVKSAFWLAKKFQTIRFEHIGRAYNTKADRLSNTALSMRPTPSKK